MPLSSMAIPRSPPDSVEVRVPPKAGMLTVLRAVTASVASRASFGDDEIEECRLMVGEAAAMLLSGNQDPGSPLVMTISAADDALAFRLSCTGVPARAKLAREWSWQIISSLADTVTREGTLVGTVMTMRRRRRNP
jgi:serine/threonine-protein kinase RsbW